MEKSINLNQRKLSNANYSIITYYGKWSNNAENKKRIEEANKNNAEKYVLART